jgi:hypothetical protein
MIWKKKKKKKEIRAAVENNYLKQLEEAVTGDNVGPIYKDPRNELKKQEQLRRLRGQVPIHKVENSIPEKEPPRIPIEFALGGEENNTPAVIDAPPEVIVEKEVESESSVLQAPPVREAPPAPPEVQPKPQPAPQVKPAAPSGIREDEDNSLFDDDMLYAKGEIIRLEDGSIGIYKGPIPGKEYHLVYHLRPDGTMRPEGIYLYAYQSESLGKVSFDVLGEMQKSMRWERERIIEHLSSVEKSRLIPLLSSKVIKKEIEASPEKQNSLVRGRRLKVGIGSRNWESVYWGSDELGEIVAHNTNGTWTLMHLNLGRFGSSLEYGEILSPDELKAINHSLSEMMSVGD